MGGRPDYENEVRMIQMITRLGQEAAGRDNSTANFVANFLGIDGHRQDSPRGLGRVSFRAGSILLFALLLGDGHAAESVRIDALSLEQALELAERHHPELAEARALAEAAGGRSQQSGTLPNPELIGRVEGFPVERNSSREPDYLVGVSQALPLSGRLGKARQADQRDQSRLIRETEWKRLELRKAVHGAFATALYQESADKLQADITSDLRTAVGIARARVAQGDAIPDELARAEMELARGRVELQRSQAMQRQALADLGSAMGVSDLVVGGLTGELEAVLELATVESVSLDLENSPSLEVARAAVDEKRARIDLARAERVPDLKVEALYRRLESTRENTIDLGVAIPLPLFDRNQGRLRAARAELAATEARARSTATHTEVRFRESQSRLAASLDQARSLRAEILPRAEMIKASMERRHQAGDISLAELIPVNRDWTAIQLTYLETLREVMAAWTDVRALAGVL
jgi:outer membrane protein, heavy metal efflux system